MVFIGGPRQVGKTTLALSLLGPERQRAAPGLLQLGRPAGGGAAAAGRAAARTSRSSSSTRSTSTPAGATCSRGSTTPRSPRVASSSPGRPRLDYYRKGGDSLANRYRYFRLHPFSLRELDPTPSGAAPRRAAPVRRLPGAALPSGRGRAPHLAARPAGAGRPRGPARPGAGPRGEPRRAARRPAAGARRLAVVGRQPPSRTSRSITRPSSAG